MGITMSMTTTGVSMATSATIATIMVRARLFFTVLRTMRCTIATRSHTPSATQMPYIAEPASWFCSQITVVEPPEPMKGSSPTNSHVAVNMTASTNSGRPRQ